MTKFLMLIFCTLLAFSSTNARADAWQPAPGHVQIPLWPAGAIPDAQPITKPEETKVINNPLAAGKPWTEVSNVSKPTITVYSPKGKNTRVAVVVFPGGAYEILAIDLQGTEICNWLTSQGITCVLLKYRVPAVPRTAPNWGAYPQSPMALEDAQRAMGLVRSHASEWHIDPHKVGVMGFSAGGHLAAATSTHFNQRIYQPIDAADKQSSRPDFTVAVYPGHLWIDPKKFELNPNVPVTRQTPRTFLLQVEDDPVDNVNDSLVYYIALKNAGVPVEMHLYTQGGHGFGVRHTQLPIAGWPRLVERWLRTIGMT
ncbi:MAG: alpha/beta hydrolase [Gammaproteobacteria bacterium]